MIGLLPANDTHGRRFPSGVELSRIVQAFFRRAVRYALGPSAPTFQEWLWPLTYAAMPVLRRYYEHGAALANGEWTDEPVTHYAKEKPPKPSFWGRAYGAARDFAKKIVAVATKGIQKVIDKLRTKPADDATPEDVLTDEAAATIAEDEAINRLHEGYLDRARELAPYGTLKVWHAEAGACPYCANLDGRTVPLDEPFDVRPDGPLMAPLAHKHCRCTVRLIFPPANGQPARYAYNPNEPRDAQGRWTDGGPLSIEERRAKDRRRWTSPEGKVHFHTTPHPGTVIRVTDQFDGLLEQGELGHHRYVVETWDVTNPEAPELDDAESRGSLQSALKHAQRLAARIEKLEPRQN